MPYPVVLVSFLFFRLINYSFSVSFHNVYAEIFGEELYKYLWFRSNPIICT